MPKQELWYKQLETNTNYLPPVVRGVELNRCYPDIFAFIPAHAASVLKLKQMLSNISWQQYLTAIILISICWYAYVGLRYYQPEISLFFKIKPKGDAIMPSIASTPHSPVIGQIKPDTGTSLENPDELIFSTSSTDDIGDQTIPKGSSDDLLAEAETLVNAFSESEDKVGFLSLFRVLVDKYQAYSDEIALPQIVTKVRNYASEKLPFIIRADEWPLNFES